MKRPSSPGPCGIPRTPPQGFPISMTGSAFGIYVTLPLHSSTVTTYPVTTPLLVDDTMPTAVTAGTLFQ